MPPPTGSLSLAATAKVIMAMVNANVKIAALPRRKPGTTPTIQSGEFTPARFEASRLSARAARDSSTSFTKRMTLPADREQLRHRRRHHTGQ